MKKCKTCDFRWFGNHLHQNFAQWYCRLNGYILIGETGSEQELKKAKGCWKWRKTHGL